MGLEVRMLERLGCDEGVVGPTPALMGRLTWGAIMQLKMCIIRFCYFRGNCFEIHVSWRVRIIR